MNRLKVKVVWLLCSLVFVFSVSAQPNKPLRIFIRAGVKTHGPNQHDHPRFLKEFKDLLNQRGAVCDGAMTFPTAVQLDNTDVLVVYCQEGGTIKTEDRASLDKFLQRGGGIVVVHDAVCGTDAPWFKTIVGGAWEHGRSKWYEGEIGFYVVDPEHPITKGVSNFDIKDEIYWDLHMLPEAHVLATSFHSVFNPAPQMWVYEKDNYRAFVDILGHEYATFEAPHTRALLLRGIAWAGKRDVDLLLNDNEKSSLRYPPGGPTPPTTAASKLIVHPDFNLSLVASEPLIEKAISLDWDPKGRLWVAETPEYPNGRRINPNDAPIYPRRKNVAPGQQFEDRPARDRISWLEDSNGDGIMDKKAVFYDGLELVTSLVFYKDGVIVDQAPDILWIRDTDGDGKADKVVKLFTGFGTGDTHAVPSNLRWGMDGWVYSTVGYSAGNPKSPDGTKDFGRITAGVFRFKPDGSAIEQVASGSCNTWGLDFTWDNEIIYSTATCGEPICHVVMPEKALARGNVGGVRATASIIERNKVFPAVQHTRAAYVQIDWVGAFTAAAGSCVYNGGAWPERYNNSQFIAEPTVNLVHHELLSPNGVTYAGKKEEGRQDVEFLAGTDLWFRPIHQRVGPDGALYVLDFYNQAAIHNDTRGPKHGAYNAATRPDRDHYFSRVWRVQHKQAKPLPSWKLDTKDPAGLVKMLDHPNGWVRQTAQRLLAENLTVN